MEATPLSEETIERLLKGQRWGVCDAGTADIGGVDLKTVHRFQKVAAQRAQAHHEHVARDLRGEGGQLDEMHSQLRGRRVEGLHTALAMGSLSLLWVHLGPRTQERAALLMAQVVARLRPLPLWLTDGWKAYRAAVLQVLGRVYHRRRRGARGRHPNPLLVPPADLCYAQVVKVRDATGTLVQVLQRGISGEPRRFFRPLAERGLGQTIQTAFMERWYGTRRGLGPPLRRRTRCGSASGPRHRGRIWLLVDLYNVVLSHKSSRRQGYPRTPAMAIGVASHGGSYREDMGHPVHPDPQRRQALEQRLQTLLTPAPEPS